ncbi:hypothetical protein H6P81_006010 [Aristolochia fimbriata]|uniref:Uncharacterized protein n=1 Tax=Aristolochia fimbriata TaxID=158543 RepID=A0AAV7EZV7_ARIFI|nr:hypothetical protein H6P81_006010 [Aristolochia fimbriata]
MLLAAFSGLIQICKKINRNKARETRIFQADKKCIATDFHYENGEVDHQMSTKNAVLTCHGVNFFDTKKEERKKRQRNRTGRRPRLKRANVAEQIRCTTVKRRQPLDYERNLILRPQWESEVGPTPQLNAITDANYNDHIKN